MGRSNNQRDNARQFKGTNTVDSGLLLTEVPPPPETFDEVTSFWWNFYCGLLIEAKCLSRLYVGSIKNFCKVSAAIEELEELINEEGFITEVPKKFNGEEYVAREVHPQHQKLLKLYDLHDKLAGSLGLTPYSAKVNAMDLTGNASASSAPEPPPVEIDRPTLPISESA